MSIVLLGPLVIHLNTTALQDHDVIGEGTSARVVMWFENVRLTSLANQECTVSRRL